VHRPCPSSARASNVLFCTINRTVASRGVGWGIKSDGASTQETGSRTSNTTAGTEALDPTAPTTEVVLCTSTSQLNLSRVRNARHRHRVSANPDRGVVCDSESLTSRCTRRRGRPLIFRPGAMPSQRRKPAKVRSSWIKGPGWNVFLTHRNWSTMHNLYHPYRRRDYGAVRRSSHRSTSNEQ
jgi:hypothetical protein